ncbi:hypothetical protein MTR_8g469250 [Medicago truncatula]|uniref:Uncharacterized protein n=1 Tax=Medicago truncatula TaxID=3880 RepID=A0A072TSL2_MEDTR|nr:hypothetical protein MTR_8g469250 [Medicago truncatula]
MGDLPGSFLISVRVIGNPESSLGCYKWYQSSPLAVRCGLGMNQAEAGGHVTLEYDEGGEWFGSWHASRQN